VGIALQSSLFSSWPWSYFQPDIVLLLVVWCALRRSFEEGGCLTLIMAEIAEIHSSAPQGVFLVSYISVYLVMRVAARVLVIPTLSAYAGLALLGSLLWKITHLIVLYLLGAGSPWKHTLIFLCLGAATEGLASLWLYPWLSKLDWITYKNSRAERALDDELQLDGEGF
jgi:hypothetical protein